MAPPYYGDLLIQKSNDLASLIMTLRLALKFVLCMFLLQLWKVIVKYKRLCLLISDRLWLGIEDT